jgi:hypothetical protein
MITASSGIGVQPSASQEREDARFVKKMTMTMTKTYSVSFVLCPPRECSDYYMYTVELKVNPGNKKSCSEIYLFTIGATNKVRLGTRV